LIDYLNTYAEDIVLIVILVLGLFSLIVFIGAIYSRWMLKLSEKRKEKIRQELSEKVIQYACGDISFQTLTRSLSTKTDYAILLKISNELDKTFEGDEEARLKRLMNLPKIRSFFLDRFESGNPLEKAKACLYFSKKTDIKKINIPKILKLTGAEHPMLAYAAGMAIINHGNIDEKAIAIRNLLLNEGLSNQALNDVFAEYQKSSTDDREAESKLLIDLIDKREYSDERTALMIRTIGELGFFEGAGFLLQEFRELPEEGYSPIITVALIDVLALFGMEEILDHLTTKFISSEYSEVRESVAKALGVFSREDSIPFLKWLVTDIDFYVRFYAAKSLSAYSTLNLRTIRIPNMDKEEFDELLGEVEASRDGGS
jgi:hypothetical protein